MHAPVLYVSISTQNLKCLASPIPKTQLEAKFNKLAPYGTDG